MVNTERIKLWRDALTSGDYDQGYDALNRDGKYCCLGVACEVAVKNGLELKTNSSEYGITYDNTNTSLPPSVVGLVRILG